MSTSGPGPAPGPLPDPGDGPGPAGGRLRPTAPGALVGFGVLGLVLGWAIRPLCLRAGWMEPRVSWGQIASIAFVGLIVLGMAALTRRTLQRSPHRLAPHQSVNRLVLGKACALVGALLTGGYAGYALAQLWVSDPASQARLWHSLIATVAGVSVLVGALLLEHACRVPPGDD